MLLNLNFANFWHILEGSTSAVSKPIGMWEDAPAMTRILLVMYPLSWFLTMIMDDFMVRLTSPYGIVI